MATSGSCACDLFPDAHFSCKPTLTNMWFIFVVNVRKYLECLGFDLDCFFLLFGTDEIRAAPNKPLGYRDANHTNLKNGTSIFLVKEHIANAF